MSATQAVQIFFKWYLVLDMFSVTVSTNPNGCRWQGGKQIKKLLDRRQQKVGGMGWAACEPSTGLAPAQLQTAIAMWE